MDRDDDIWNRMLLWVSEHTGVSRADAEKVIESSNQFWVTHLRLSMQFMADDEDVF
jgi:hypothetical protein